MLIREAFLRGISTRQVGRVVATLTGEVVSAQTVSKLTRVWTRRCASSIEARLSRRLCLSVFGRSEPAGAASGGAQAGADAGGLRRAARRHAPSAGLFAQPG